MRLSLAAWAPATRCAQSGAAPWIVDGGRGRAARPRPLERQPIAANCFHPAVIRTGFGKNDGALARISLSLAAPFLRSPESGAGSLVWLALERAAGELRGQYTEKRQPVQPSTQAQNDDLAAQLWERSDELVAPARPT